MLKPLNDCVLIEPDEFEAYHKYKGLEKIVVPDRYEHGPEDRNFSGTVLDCGEKCSQQVKKGDQVIWGKWTGAKFVYKQRNYYIVRDYDLLGRLDGK